jgi:hypothetical protein
MSDVHIDFTPLFVAAGIGAICALAGTPLLWRFGAGLAAWRRAVLALLGALGVAGLAAVYAGWVLRDRELAGFAMILTILLQCLVLPVLLLLNRKKTKA